VDLDTAFATFGPKTQAGIRRATAEFGDAVAGRGPQFNDAIYQTRLLLPPLERLLRLFASPSTHLSQFVGGLAATTGGLAPVAPTITSLLDRSAKTFAALGRSSLGGAIDAVPPTEAVATPVLTRSLPVLRDAAFVVQGLKPGAALLPLATGRFDAIITSATPVFRGVPKLAAKLNGTLAAIDAVAHDPATVQTFKVLGSSDLATFGASAFIGLGAILRTAAHAQFACNTIGLWVRNFASALSEGDQTAAWLRFAPIVDPQQTFQAATPAPDLHLNVYPQENSHGCQGANDVYRGAQRIGDPGPTSTVVDNTQPPAGVLERGRKAGLVP
jgi:hypothetical protein